MKFTKGTDQKTYSDIYTLEITQADYRTIESSKTDRILIKECEQPRPISFYLMVLERLAQRIEEHNK